MRHIAHLTLAAALLLLAGCKTTKTANVDPTTGTITAPVTPVQHAAAIASNFKDWTTMQCGGNIKLGGSNGMSSSINVRMERGKSIAISLRPMLGIEVGRLVFSGDSVIVVDKLHKQYIAEDVSLITNGLPATLEALQDIFLGRAFVLGEGTYSTALEAKVQLEQAEDRCVLRPTQEVKGFGYEFAFDKNDDIVSLTATLASDKGQTYGVSYSDVKSTAAGKIAHALGIDTAIKGRQLKLDLEYGNITWNQEVKIDTTIPKNYKKADIASVAALLGGK